MKAKSSAKKQKIQFTLSADIELSSLVRQISEAVFKHAGFTQEWVDRLKLVVDELFMNATRYGSTKDSKLYLCYCFEKESVDFLIEDEGGKNLNMTAEELKKIVSKNVAEINDLTKKNGRGLALFSRLWTDQLTIQDSQHGGIAVSFSKKITE